MKKKHIIQIIIGIVLICGIGYAIYQEIERNKEDYFVIETKKENIDDVLKDKKIEVIHKWFDKEKNSYYAKVKTKEYIYKILKDEKNINIEYVVQIKNGECVYTSKEDRCIFQFSEDISEREKKELSEKIGKIKALEKGGYSKEEINEIKKYGKIKKIYLLNYVQPKHNVGEAV